MAVFIKEGVAIIGAGPAGLGICGQLKKRNIHYTLFEKSSHVASSWRGHYDRLCLHTVKQLSHLPHMPFPRDFPTYVPKDKLISYYENYCKEFEINPLLDHELKNVEKAVQGWKLIFTNGDQYLFKSIVFATGVNRLIHSPSWEGQADYKGEVLHSRNYKNPDKIKGQSILIIGMGNTGAEIALDLCESGKQVSLSVRDQVIIVPRDIFGNPSQVTANRLAKLPNGIGDWIGNIIRKIIIGNVSKYGLKSNPVAPVKHLRKTGRTPIMDLGTIKLIKRGKISVFPDIKKFTKTGCTFIDDTELEFDTVILATGYKAGITDFIELPAEFLDFNNLPKGVKGPEGFDGLFFLGFDNYQVGGILGAIYRDSEIIANELETLNTT